MVTPAIFVLGFVGLRTLNDLTKPVAQQVESVKQTIDHLSGDVDVQAKRVTERGGEIATKFASLDVAASEAQKKGEEYKSHADELFGQLTAMEASLQHRVEQVSKQVDSVSIQQAFPNLGEPRYVTYLNKPWKGGAGKAPGEKWVNVSVALDAWSNFSTDQLEALSAELKKTGYMPLPTAGPHVLQGPDGRRCAARDVAFPRLRGTRLPSAGYRKGHTPHAQHRNALPPGSTSKNEASGAASGWVSPLRKGGGGAVCMCRTIASSQAAMAIRDWGGTVHPTKLVCWRRPAGSVRITGCLPARSTASTFPPL